MIGSFQIKDLKHHNTFVYVQETKQLLFYDKEFGCFKNIKTGFFFKEKEYDLHEIIDGLNYNKIKLVDDNLSYFFSIKKDALPNKIRIALENFSIKHHDKEPSKLEIIDFIDSTLEHDIAEKKQCLEFIKEQEIYSKAYHDAVDNIKQKIKDKL